MGAIGLSKALYPTGIESRFHVWRNSGFFGLEKGWLWASIAEICNMLSGGRGSAHRSFVQEPEAIEPRIWRVHNKSRG